MITPDQVLTHKNDPEGQIRTANILNDYCEGRSLEVVAKNYGLTAPAVWYLLKKNALAIKLDANLEKVVRVNRLKRVFNEPVEIIPKDVDDICKLSSELRKELEGDSSSINSSVQIYNINGERADRFKLKIHSSQSPAANPAE
jgi:hypothetical protein